MEENKREHFASSIGFVLAMVGSAVGLGNIWRFPYITGVNGGGAFVLIYLLSICLVGIPIMFCEMAIGRKTQSQKLKNKPKLDSTKALYFEVENFANIAQ